MGQQRLEPGGCASAAALTQPDTTVANRPDDCVSLDREQQNSGNVAMLTFVNADYSSIEQSTLPILRAGGNVCFVGKTRKGIFTNVLHRPTIRATKFTLEAQEHLYVFFGHYWQSLAGDSKSLKKEWWMNFRTEAMKGAGFDGATKTLRPRRRFFLFTKRPHCGIFEYEQSLLVHTITNKTAERAEVSLAPHLNRIMENAKATKARVWTYNH